MIIVHDAHIVLFEQVKIDLVGHLDWQLCGCLLECTIKFKLLIIDYFEVPENIRTLTESFFSSFNPHPKYFPFQGTLWCSPGISMIFFYLGPARPTHCKFNIRKITTLTLFLFICYSVGTEIILSCSCLWLHCR